MTASGIWAAVPVKSLAHAKQRLAPVLSPGQRRRLVLAMLHDVLDVLARTPGLAGVLVVSPDPDVLALAAVCGATPLAQAGDVGLPESADAAARAVATYGADCIMVVPADLPLACPADFLAMLAAPVPDCVIAPSADGSGSNCVRLPLPAAIGFQFGPDSFRKHLDATRAAGLATRVVHRAGLARDIDEPGDLARLRGATAGAHVRQVLATLEPTRDAPRLACLERLP